MNFKNAWLALNGKLPLTIEEVKVVEKSPDLSKVVARDLGLKLFGYSRAVGGLRPNVNPYADKNGEPTSYMTEAWMRWEMNEPRFKQLTERVYAMSCDQAHSESDNAFVESVDAVKIGDDYYRFEGLTKVKLADKPKIDKG